MKAKLPKFCSFIFCVAELAKKSEFVTLFYSNSPHFSPKIKNQTLASSKAGKIPSVQTIFFKLSLEKLLVKKSEMKMSLSYIPTSAEAERLFSLFEKACNCLNKKICWEHIFL
jgi:hypothetical protein